MSDFNHARYQQLTKTLPEKQQSLQGVAAAALKLGYSPKQVTGILSASPSIKNIRQKSGEAASQNASKAALQEGLKISGTAKATNKQQQSKQRPRGR